MLGVLFFVTTSEGFNFPGIHANSCSSDLFLHCLSALRQSESFFPSFVVLGNTVESCPGVHKSMN